MLSVSNQYVTSSTEYPIEIDRRKVRRTKLHHWSWIDLLTQATVQKEYRGISDPDQAYILGELIRYLADHRSGAVAFDVMGSGWTAVRDGAREQTLRKSDAAVIASDPGGVVFTEIGPVELKAIAEPLRLHTARRRV